MLKAVADLLIASKTFHASYGWLTSETTIQISCKSQFCGDVDFPFLIGYLFLSTLPRLRASTRKSRSGLSSFYDLVLASKRVLNRGRNLELKNETSKFRPLFLRRKPRIQATFSWLPAFAELGHPKAKIGKSQCKNENGSNPNPEFSYTWGFLFFYPVILLCLFRSFILQGRMRTFGIVEDNKMGDSPHQIRFRRIVPAV